MTENKEDLVELARQAADVLIRMLRENDRVMAIFDRYEQEILLNEVRAEGPFLTMIGVPVSRPNFSGDPKSVEWAGTVQDLKVRFRAEQYDKNGELL